MNVRNLMTVVILLFVAGDCHGGTDASPLSISDMMGVKHLQDQQLSPDGSQIAFVVAAADFETNAYQFSLLLINVATGKQTPICTSFTLPSPCWSDDGNSLAFFERTAATTYLCVFDLHSSKIEDRRTSVSIKAGSLAWAPDGKALAYLAPDSTLDEASHTRLADALPESMDLDRKQLYLCDRMTGITRQLSKHEGHVSSFCWSPDASRIAYSAQPLSSPNDHVKSDLWTLAVATGNTARLVERPGGDAQPRWSPNGEQIAFLSQDGNDSFMQTYAICVIPAKGGTVRSVSREWEVPLGYTYSDSHTWSTDSRSLYVPADQGMMRQLYRVDVDKCVVQPITSTDCVHRSFSFSADEEQMAFAIDSPSMPADLYVSSVSEFEPKRVVELNPQLKDKSLGDAEVFRWTSNDGTAVEGLLVKPTNCRPGIPVPLVTYLHGGPAGNFMYAFATSVPMSAPQTGFCPVQVLAGRGYAVFCPNPRGSDGYGRKFRESNMNAWGEGDLQDVLTGIDELVTLRVADPARLAITGYCYGGYLGLRALTRTDRFRTACLGASFGDLASFYGQTDMPGLLAAYFGCSPTQNRAHYEQCSPLLEAHKITTPVLMFHAKNDQRVPWTQSKQLYTTLKEAGTPAELITYPRVKHSIVEPRLNAETMRQTVLWYERWFAHPEASPSSTASESESTKAAFPDGQE